MTWKSKLACNSHVAYLFDMSYMCYELSNIYILPVRRYTNVNFFCFWWQYYLSTDYLCCRSNPTSCLAMYVMYITQRVISGWITCPKSYASPEKHERPSTRVCSKLDSLWSVIRRFYVVIYSRLYWESWQCRATVLCLHHQWISPMM